VQIAEKEILIVVALLVVQLTRTLLLHHSNTMLPMYCSQYCRVANLVFMKPGLEILAFFNTSGFSGSIKSLIKSRFFIIGKVWLWQNIVWAAYSYQISFDESLWPRGVHRILQRFYCCPKNDRCYW